MFTDKQTRFKQNKKKRGTDTNFGIQGVPLVFVEYMVLSV